MSEKSAVQNPMLQYAESIGWERLTADQALALRCGVTESFCPAVLREQLLRLNPGVVNKERADEITRRLRNLRTTIEGNRDMLLWLRGEMSVFVVEEKRERNVLLMDFENPDNNVFHVTDEWRQKGAKGITNRADVVFLVNGIPVAVCETKDAGKPNGAAEGVAQIRRYHAETPEMMLCPQAFSVTQMLDFYYGPTWNASRKSLFNWRDDAPEDTAYEAKVKGFFDRARFLRMLKEYILFLTKDDVLTKVILRQHQTRAVEKAVERALHPAKRHGLIWHTQGSGKTLTMITIASKLLRETKSGEKPTVLMLVDRNELESQLFQNISAYGITTAKVAGSKRELQDILASDYRGLVVSMIHKFDDIPAKINQRSSIIVLVDEAHRTTGGDLGNYLMGALPNATYIGFTGTPIDNLSKGKGTFKTFGADDERGYLDKYSIAESIQDGTTVALNYALAPSDLRVDRETLEKRFFALAETEGVSDIEELNAILERAVELKEMMKAPDRVERVAQKVAEHYTTTVEPMGFKAFLVAVDREACVLYKQALDHILPPEYSEVVISGNHNDPSHLKAATLDPAREKEVRKAFIRRDSLPKILIVTEKLLTGFDAPILYCMYLDKPMRDHVLLQAIARVNRPYEDEDGRAKPYGFVLDFVGIFEKLEKALAFDSDVVASVIQNLDVLQAFFETLMREKAAAYLPFAQGWTDKEKEHAIDHFQGKETREAFYRFFRQAQTLYDILSPAPALYPHIRAMEQLTMLYTLLRQAYSPRVYVDRELTTKTRELLREQTDLAALELPNQIHTLGPAELAALKDSDASDTTKILNLRKALLKVVEEEGESQPFLLSIGERAEALAQLYEDRQIETQQVLAAYGQMAAGYLNAGSERQALGLDANAYAIYTVLKPLAASVESVQVRAMNDLFAQFSDYDWDEEQNRQLRARLYNRLLPIVGPGSLVAAANALLRLKRVAQ